jgi:hypothetical protein
LLFFYCFYGSESAIFWSKSLKNIIFSLKNGHFLHLNHSKSLKNTIFALKNHFPPQKHSKHHFRPQNHSKTPFLHQNTLKNTQKHHFPPQKRHFPPQNHRFRTKKPPKTALVPTPRYMRAAPSENLTEDQLKNLKITFSRVDQVRFIGCF